MSDNHKQIRILAVLAIFFASSAGRIIALDPTSHISQYGHRVWRVRDGYFGGRALDITQTTDGYIWVGTEAGLFKFDGLRFVRWSAHPGEQLPSSRILSLLGARDGSLWVCVVFRPMMVDPDFSVGLQRCTKSTIFGFSRTESIGC
jgi:ligand-binding sensor domain-containing protein